MKRPVHGFFLIEAMVALLIFSLGILGMVAMGGIAVTAESDARYRTAAAQLADEIAATIALNVNRSNANPPFGLPTSIQTSIMAFQHQPTTGGTGSCTFSGAASANADVLAWAAKARTTGYGLPGLPGASAASQQIVINNTTGFNRVQITLCWQAPSDSFPRHLTYVTYIN